MESDFYELWNIAIDKDPFLRLVVEYSKVCDWIICISKGRASESTQLFYAQNCNRKLIYAEAYVWLCNYLSEIHGGY
jgi:hypothetical protein